MLEKGGLVESNGWRLLETSGASGRCPWGTRVFPFQSDGGAGANLGHLCIGTRRGAAFYVVVQYPEEYEEGFVPRAERVLQELRWSDDNEGLKREESAG